MNYGPSDKAVVRFARKTEKEGDESMRVPFDISQTHSPASAFCLFPEIKNSE
jgi:hypothetical protein